MRIFDSRPNGGKQVCEMIICIPLVNCRTRENFFHSKISCFRVLFHYVYIQMVQSEYQYTI